MARASLITLILIITVAVSKGQQSIFFENLVTFDVITTDSGRALGNHLDYWHVLSDEIQKRTRIVSVNRKGEVYWCNWPDVPVEQNRMHVGQSWLDSTWYEPRKPFACFKTVLENNKIYYRRCDKPRFKLLEASLNKTDTVSPYDKSHLSETKMPVNQTMWYRHYIGDSVIRIGPSEVPCFLFEDIGHLEGELRKDQQFVEKASLLPVLTVSKYYDQGYDPAIKHYKYTLERIVVQAPSIYIEELMGKKN